MVVNIESIIRDDLIDKTLHMSLATARDAKPWVCEVHFAYDKDLNLYFVSKTGTRHCRDISDNHHVSGNIVKQHLLTEAPSGLYFEGTAKQIEATTQDIDRFSLRLQRDAAQLSSQLVELNGKRMYKVSVSNWAIFGNFDGSGHVKHVIDWGKS